jgi:replicative DNA helicase
MIPALLPPQANEAERSCLGAALISRTASEALIDALGAEDFYQSAHRRIFQAISHLASKGIVPDTLTVLEKLQDKHLAEGVGGLAYLNELAESVPTAAHIEYYVALVRRASLLRQAVGFGEWFSHQAYQFDGDDVTSLFEEAEQRLFRFTQAAKAGKTASNTEHIRPLVLDVVRRATGDMPPVPLVKTGWGRFDWQLGGGFQQDDLIILGARPSVGKTACCVDILKTAAKAGHGVLMLSLEMSKAKIARRLLANEARISVPEFELVNSDERLMDALFRASGVVGELPIYIHDLRDVTIAHLRSECRRMVRQQDIGLIVLDYIQLVQPPAKGLADARHFTQVGEGLKSLARELHVPVIALSQLNREVEKRAVQKPQLSDLRECGGLEAAADVVVLMYREAYYRLQKGESFPGPDDTEFLFAKVKDGHTGVVHLWFEREAMRFHAEEREEAPPLPEPGEDWSR